jgi:hypothetical protein
MRILGRLLLIALAYVLATFAATLAFTLSNVVMQSTGGNYLSLNVLGNAISTTMFFWLVLGHWIAAIPFLVAIFISEFFAIRSFLLHLAGGIAVALVTPFFAALLLFINTIALTGERIALAVAAGIAAGLVYWLIAGRKAGSWKGV